MSLLTGGAGNSNYFHWLYDVLPRIGIYEKISNINNIDYFLLPDTKKKFQKETLDKLNIPLQKRLSSKNFRHITGSEIIVTDHPYCIKNDASNEIQNIPIWISKWLREKYLVNNQIETKELKKIYIDRSDSSSNTKKYRSIINEEDVKKFLEKIGFNFISLSNFSFEEQVKIINKADFIVGLHGAGFANLCFCKPKTKILELKSNTAGKMYENLAKNNDLIYKTISCHSEKFDYKNQYGHINVSIKELEKSVGDLLKDE